MDTENSLGKFSKSVTKQIEPSIPVIYIKEEPLDDSYMLDVTSRNETDVILKHESEFHEELNIEAFIKFENIPFIEENNEDLKVENMDTHQEDQTTESEDYFTVTDLQKEKHKRYYPRSGRKFLCRFCYRFCELNMKSESLIKCDVCEQIDNTDSEVNVEMPSLETDLTCVFCNLEFTQKEALNSHLRGHKLFRSRCNKRFKEIKDLKVDIIKHKPYYREICDKNFSDAFSFKYHNSMHTGKLTYKCDECGRIFLKMYQLKDHTREHTGEKPKCDHCNKYFNHRSWLDFHYKTCQARQERLFKCDQCDRSFVTDNELKCHTRAHNSTSIIRCTQCNLGFDNIHVLKIHLKVHEMVLYKCGHCPLSFFDEKVLKLHLNVHNYDKPFKCDVCKKNFSSKGSLTSHLKKHDD